MTTVTEDCSCGATTTITSDMSSTVSTHIERFHSAHAACREVEVYEPRPFHLGWASVGAMPVATSMCTDSSGVSTTQCFCTASTDGSGIHESTCPQWRPVRHGS